MVMYLSLSTLGWASISAASHFLGSHSASPTFDCNISVSFGSRYSPTLFSHLHPICIKHLHLADKAFFTYLNLIFFYSNSIKFLIFPRNHLLTPLMKNRHCPPELLKYNLYFSFIWEVLVSLVIVDNFSWCAFMTSPHIL